MRFYVINENKRIIDGGEFKTFEEASEGLLMLSPIFILSEKMLEELKNSILNVAVNEELVHEKYGLDYNGNIEVVDNKEEQFMYIFNKDEVSTIFYDIQSL